MDPSLTSGASGFRFSRAEVAEMEVLVRRFDGRRITSAAIFDELARRFTASREHEGKPGVQPKQVRNWFHNRHYHREPRILKDGKKDTLEEMPLLGYQQHTAGFAASHVGSSSGNNHKEDSQFNFEAKSKRDGAWYTVYTFLSHRKLESGDQEVMVRFCGFGAMEDEWVDLHQCVRRRSLPCRATDCVAVVCGDSVLCLQEGKEQALNFDACVLDVQRRRHDLRGCRCRFLSCYAHDKTQEIVPSIKLSRRPESEYRLQPHAAGVDFANLCAFVKRG